MLGQAGMVTGGNVDSRTPQAPSDINLAMLGSLPLPTMGSMILNVAPSRPSTRTCRLAISPPEPEVFDILLRI